MVLGRCGLSLEKDQYKMNGDRIVLQGPGAVGWIEMKYKGLIYLRSERGELMIRYDNDRKKWYACIAFEVSEKMMRGNGGRCHDNRKAT